MLAALLRKSTPITHLILVAQVLSNLVESFIHACGQTCLVVFTSPKRFQFDSAQKLEHVLQGQNLSWQMLANVVWTSTSGLSNAASEMDANWHVNQKSHVSKSVIHSPDYIVTLCYTDLQT